MDIEVKMGEIKGGRCGETLTASGVGSCLIITLFDPELKTGAMAHVMLPSRDRRRRTKDKGSLSDDLSSKAKRENNLAKEESERASNSAEAGDTKYTDTAIDEMLKRLEAQGSKRGRLEAKIVGGANMFTSFVSDIGRENVLSAKENLKEKDISIVGECVGGSQGRSVEFSVSSGIVSVKVKF